MRKAPSTMKLLLGLIAVLSMLLVSCGDSDVTVTITIPAEESTVSARLADESDLLSGPLARGLPGDFVLENEHLRVIIQQPGRQWLSIGTFGGNIIDVSARDDSGALLPDHLEEFVLGINIENTPNYTEVYIDNSGANGELARICATGPDDLLELANASSVISGFGVELPASADDRDLPIDIETCYTVKPGDRYITMESRLINQDNEDLAVYMNEYLDSFCCSLVTSLCLNVTFLNLELSSSFFLMKDSMKSTATTDFARSAINDVKRLKSSNTQQSIQ